MTDTMSLREVTMAENIEREFDPWYTSEWICIWIGCAALVGVILGYVAHVAR